MPQQVEQTVGRPVERRAGRLDGRTVGACFQFEDLATVDQGGRVPGNTWARSHKSHETCVLDDV